MSDTSIESDLELVRTRVKSAERTFGVLRSGLDESPILERAFFERLVVLAGGTITLSITLVGTFVSKKAVPHSIWTIEAAWCLLAVCLVFGLLRNLLESSMVILRPMTGLLKDLDYIDEHGSETFQSEPEIDNIVSIIRRNIAPHRKRFTLVGHFFKVAGHISLLSLIAGYASLVAFAIINIHALLS